MVKNFIDRLKTFFKTKSDQNLILSANAYFNIAKKNYGSIKNLKDTEFKVFSQNGEDGIINYLIHQLEIKKIKFVEIGVGDYTECNTRFLTNNFPFKGLVCDYNKKLGKNLENLVSTHRGEVKIFNHFVYKDNVLEILNKYDFFNDINLFSLDIDGNDYFILNALPNSFADIFVVEYNQNFGPNLEISTPYIDNFDRYQYHYSGLCWGVSIKALVKLMERKGYAFVGTNTECCNAFFIKMSFINRIDKSIFESNHLDKACNDYVCDAKDKNGKRIYLPVNDRLQLIKDAEVINLSNEDSKNRIKVSNLLHK